MEFLEVLVWGKTVKSVSVEQIGEELFNVTVGRAEGDEGPDGEYHFPACVYGRSQVVVARSMYDACYKAHHLAKVIG